MPVLTVAFPDELYNTLQEQAASQGTSIEAVIIERLSAETRFAASQEAIQERIHMALAASGLLEPVSAELLTAYLSDATAPRHKPLHIPGQPLSETIIEQRRALR